MAKKEEQTQTEVKTKLIKCTCKHVFQDGEYGIGMRLHNRGNVVGNKRTWVCTVCNKRL